MNTSLPLILLLAALIVVTAGMAALLAFAPADHMISFSIAAPVPLWLLQLHQFAASASSQELRFEAHQEPVGVAAETTRPKRVRRARSDDSQPRAMREQNTGLVVAVLADRIRNIWRKVSELLEDLASKSYFGVRSNINNRGVGSYDMWTNEEDSTHEDSDACTKLYRDSKQHQVCAISI